MIPTYTDDLKEGFTFEEQPSKTYALNYDSGTITGFVSDLEAMQQAVFLILETERFENLIFSWNYGFERGDLIGAPVAFVVPELKRKIQEALMQDSRITAVTDFVVETKKQVVNINFSVSTIFGTIKTEKVVNI